MSSVRYIFSTSGQYVAFVSGDNLFTPAGEWLGVVEDSKEVYSKDGAFLGYLLDDDRIVRRRGERRPRRLRPPRPLRPLRPIRPLRRLRMPRLPFPYEDVFEAGAIGPSEVLTGAIQSFDHLEGARLVASDGAFLGRISRNAYDPESITNQYGPYGSQYSQTSILNPYGPYGGPYSQLSPFNPYSNIPPSIVMDEEVVGYLTKNPYLQNRIDPEELTAWLSAA